jgi:hypothetical protein
MQASPLRVYGGQNATHEAEPRWRALPARARPLSDAFLAIRERIHGFLADYYDGEHLTRAGDWMLALEPDADEHLVVAALMHDAERKVPGGPALRKTEDAWDDVAYNTAHTHRSAVVVPTWLMAQDAPRAWLTAVAQPIREHEFGGSPEGDLMQAADSISFLETNAPLVAGWALRGECSAEKARAKLRWMGERVRHERGREIARVYRERSLEDFDRLIEQG